MSHATQKYWPSAEPGKPLSPEQLLKGLEEKFQELEVEYKKKPSKPVKVEILNLAQRIVAHRTTQGLDIKDILPRLKALFD